MAYSNYGSLDSELKKNLSGTRVQPVIVVNPTNEVETIGGGTLDTSVNNLAPQIQRVTIADIVMAGISPVLPANYDEIVVTYYASGNGIGQINTVVYNLVSVAQKTLTFAYDASGRISTVTVT